MNEKMMTWTLIVIMPFALYLCLPRYINHLTTYPDTAVPEDLINRPSSLTEMPSRVGNR